MNKKTLKDLLCFLMLAFLVQPLMSCNSKNHSMENQNRGLKDYYSEKFLIGAALFPELFDDPVTVELIKNEFNTITAENDMKWGLLQPTLNVYNFERADRIVEFAQKYDIKLIGHTLVWHSQLGEGVFNKEGSHETDDLADMETLLERIRDHIYTVAGRYRGRIHGWDVVNEALNEDGTFRESNFFKIAGEKFIEKAFQYAHEADPYAELYYNDYNLVIPEKRRGAVNIVRNLQKKGLRIDAVGAQAHWDLEFPSLAEIENTIMAFSELGIKVMFTELDISVLPSPWNIPSADISTNYQNSIEMNPYPDGLPDHMEEALAKRYRDIFALFIKHSDKISRVTFWGLHDGLSWKNNFPIRGRTDYPLLFDREMNPRQAYHELIDLIK